MASKRKLAKIVKPPVISPGASGRKVVNTAPSFANVAGSTPARPLRKLAVIAEQKRGTSVMHAQCFDCEGSHIKGMWIHTARCPWTVVLWFGHGHRFTDWLSPFYQCCPFKCEGTRLPSGMTHAWNCPWWDDIRFNPAGDVPFMLTEPDE